MDSSPGFGSTPRDSDALFRLAFASAPPVHWLNLATEGNSPAHSSIGTLADIRRCPSTARKHTVSGTISLPFRGAFHLSLTVLVRYRSLRVFSLGRWASLLPTHFLVLRGTPDQPFDSPRAFRVLGFHRLRRPFPGPSARRGIGNCRLAGLRQRGASTTPSAHRPYRR
jgi:hypothetical protein